MVRARGVRARGRPRRGDVTGRAWGRVVFCPAGAVEGERRHTIIIASADRRSVEGVWPLRKVFHALSICAAEDRARWTARTSDDDRDSVSDLAIKLRTIAGRLPLTGISSVIDHAAERLDGFRKKKYTTSPPDGIRARLNFDFNCLLWAINELRLTAGVPPADFWQRRLNRYLDAVGVAPLSDEAVRERIQRFGRDIRAGRHDDLLGDVVGSVLLHGPVPPEPKKTNESVENGVTSV